MLAQDGNSVATISYLIELSVAPVFLIAGVAGLLNVFINRLARAIDRLETLDKYNAKKHREDAQYKEPEYMVDMRDILLKRMHNSNRAIFFATMTGLMVAMVIITVFASALMAIDAKEFIAVLFILAMVSLIIALILFVREVYFTRFFIDMKKKYHHIEE
ncbi:MAG: DUF2721 domain-containing protein [Campylobacterales bacterium]|nr:DUF2721 domain-containing protein [Campylobacterales bacterium]